MSVKSISNTTMRLDSAAYNMSAESRNERTTLVKAQAENKQISVDPVLKEKLNHMVGSGEAEIQGSYEIDNSSFAIFKLPDGKIYVRETNRSTGEIQYFPSLDSYTYLQAMKPNKGEVVEAEV